MPLFPFVEILSVFFAPPSPSRSHRSGEPRILARVAVSLLPRRACFPSSSARNRAEIGPRARSKVEEEAKAAGMDGWSCPPWTMARPLWPRKEEVTSRAPATETDTHSACSSSSAGRPATGNVRRSALPQTKATGRNTFARRMEKLALLREIRRDSSSRFFPVVAIIDRPRAI